MTNEELIKKFGEQCQHGQLKRSCEICELEGEVSALRAQLAEKDKEIERLKSDMRTEENNLVLAESELVSIEMILDGKEVSDFVLSFPVAREVYDLKRISVAQEKENAALRDKTKSIEEVYKEYRDIYDGSQDVFWQAIQKAMEEKK